MTGLSLQAAVESIQVVTRYIDKTLIYQGPTPSHLSHISYLQL